MLRLWKETLSRRLLVLIGRSLALFTTTQFVVKRWEEQQVSRGVVILAVDASTSPSKLVVDLFDKQRAAGREGQAVRFVVSTSKGDTPIGCQKRMDNVMYHKEEVIESCLEFHFKQPLQKVIGIHFHITQVLWQRWNKEDTRFWVWMSNLLCTPHLPFAIHLTYSPHILYMHLFCLHK